MRLLARILVGLVALLGLGLAAAAGAAFLLYQSIVRDLPDLRGIQDYRPPLPTTVVARDGRPIAEFAEERRRLVRLDEIPRHVILAFLASEDDSFFEHSGIDVRSILRAAYVDLTAGEVVQGASTITQQLVKTLLLSPERRFDRKLKEMILARRLEQHLTKDEILDLYLNQIYFGSGAWGVGEAALTYFGKPVGELTVGEGALLAGLPKAPSRFSPNVNPGSAEERRQYVLGRMRALGHVDEATWQDAADHPPRITGPPPRPDFTTAAWFSEEVRRALFERLGGDTVLRGGLRVETTLDLVLQAKAQEAVRTGLVALDRRQGWHGPEKRVGAAQIAAEVERLGARNGLAPQAGATPALDPAKSYLGVVTGVTEVRSRAQVALAPGVTGTVVLRDVAWARRRDAEQESVRERSISKLLAVGDVVRFRLKPATPPAPEEEREEDPESASAGPAAAEPAEAAPAEPAGEAPAGGLELVFDQDPQVEGALFALDVSNGEVLALVGGYDPKRSEFDRAVQARRQPGSAFKPFIYAVALERGFGPNSIVNDTQVVYADPGSGEVWRPNNYDRKFRGPVQLRNALAWSLNNATIRVLLTVGISPVVDLARRVGIRSPIGPYPSLALGTSPVTLLELTSAYAVFAAGGQRVTPVFIRRVLDRDGHVLLANLELREPPSGVARPAEKSAAPAEPEVGPSEPPMDPRAAFKITDLLRGPIEQKGGTAHKAAVLGRPLAGKTGTTNDQGDAWFVGFSADVAAGVWVGFDERHVLGKGETGGRAALPIWIEFMRVAHEGRPVRDFPRPEGVTYAQSDVDGGGVPGVDEAYLRSFLKGDEPKAKASDAKAATDSRRMLRMDF